ncbi:MAG: D-aminoacyl-tRNA deacylase [Planctomycetota bacterium]
MKALLQCVARAEVRVEGAIRGRIGNGLLVFLGCEQGDSQAQAREMARKIGGFRAFPDSQGRTNLDLAAVEGGILLISQFTLVADTSKGRRPSFDRALDGRAAESLVGEVAARLRSQGLLVEEGAFGARMEVELLNLGPATWLLETHGPPPPET